MYQCLYVIWLYLGFESSIFLTTLNGLPRFGTCENKSDDVYDQLIGWASVEFILTNYTN